MPESCWMTFLYVFPSAEHNLNAVEFDAARGKALHYLNPQR